MVLVQLRNRILQRVNNFRMQEKVVLSINNEEIHVNKFFAVAISQKIFNIYKLDSSTSKIDISVKLESEDTYDVLRNLLQNNKTEIDCNSIIAKDLFNIGLDLEIEELIDPYKTQVIDKMIINRNNCIELLDAYFDISCDKKISDCIDFISSHFHEIDQNNLKKISNKLGFNILESIVNNEKLLIKDEDSLMNFVISLINESEIFCSLIECVHLEMCSDQVIDSIPDICNDNNYINIVKSLHDSLLRSRSDKYCFSRYVASNNIQCVFKFLDELSIKIDHSKKDIPNEIRNDILVKACEAGNLKLVKSLIKIADKDGEDSNGSTPLITASANGKLEVVKFLVEVKKANIEKKDCDGSTPLIAASANGYLEVVKYLCDKGANREATDDLEYTPLIVASANGHLKVVKFLVEAKVNLEAKSTHGNTSLIWASRNGHLDIVKYLIEAGADKNAKNDDGSTLLIYASICGKLEIVQYLLSVGADMEESDNYGYTALLSAAHNGKLAVVEHLISAGAQKEAINNYEWTPLIAASYNGYLDVVQYLLSVGANKDAKDSDGGTPLIYAAPNDHLDVVQYLISDGANKDEKDNDGKTAQDHAKDKVRSYFLSLETKLI